MKQLIQKTLSLVAVSFSLLGLVALVGDVATVSAACNPNNLSISSGADCARGNEQPAELFGGEGSIFGRVTNILLFLVGAISVIMLIIGGIRYVISGGDQAQVTSAKNTILYAIVGIVVAFLAYAAVNFVTQALSGATAT
ncbi:TPA: hypothetical protein DCF80_02630 [Candidatus Saccharibacteria bacterium]|nr:hypothetical protein [Candidatus Saccharibacteria bacterium]HRK40577.1 pilin [Candidatus Saccharibacteria bacterium]